MPSISNRLQEIVDKLSLAGQMPSPEIDQAEAEIQRRVVILRDEIIEHLRQSGPSVVAGGHHRTLQRINVALSLIVGAEFPVTSIKRSALDQARKVLSEAKIESETLQEKS